jgi:thiamine-monophosphate kinase
MTQPRPGEDDLIARYFRPLAGEGGLALLDDAGRFRVRPGEEVVVTTDALVGGMHFFPDDPPASIARKALGVNLSDLAAKGADPLGFVLSLALPPDWTAEWLEAFAEGLGAAAAQGYCPLIGGDTVRTPGPLTLSITAFGSVPEGRMVPRTGARPGDVIVVSGSIGDAALGLAARLAPDDGWANALAEEELAHLLDRYLHPRPRLALVAALRIFASGAMDVSDGLAGDLAKMMRASGTGASVDLDAVPLSTAVRSAAGLAPSLLDRAVTGGDDYEILATVSPAQLLAFRAAAKAAGVELTPIGEVLDASQGIVYRRNGAPITFEKGSFSHF